MSVNGKGRECWLGYKNLTAVLYSSIVHAVYNDVFRVDGVLSAGVKFGLMDLDSTSAILFYSSYVFICFTFTHSRAVCCLATPPYCTALHCTAQEVLRRQTLKTFMEYRCHNMKNYQQWAEIVHEVSGAVILLHILLFLRLLLPSRLVFVASIVVLFAVVIVIYSYVGARNDLPANLCTGVSVSDSQCLGLTPSRPNPVPNIIRIIP